jgi:predicted MFS family arabinose efflux permease
MRLFGNKLIARLRIQVLAFTATRVVLNTMFRMVYPFLAVFGRGMGVDLTAMSFALTTRSLAGVLGPFLASIGDSRGRKFGMLFGITLFIFGVGLVAIWPTFPAFILAMILSMLGKYVFDPSMQAYLGDRVTYQRRGRVLAITELGWSLSFVLGVPLMGLLISQWGWKSVFPVLTLLGLLALVALSWIVPGDQPQSGAKSSLWPNFSKILTYPPVLYGLLMGFFFSAANEVINLVFGIWMENSFGLVIAALGAAAAVIGFAELSGETLVVVFTDRLGKPFAVGSGLVLNCLAALALPFLGTSTAGAFLGLFLFYSTFEYALVSSIPLMTEVYPAARATVMAVNIASFSLGRALGALVASPLFLFAESSPAMPDLLPSALVAVAFNILALVSLRLLRQGSRARHSPV